MAKNFLLSARYRNLKIDSNLINYGFNGKSVCASKKANETHTFMIYSLDSLEYSKADHDAFVSQLRTYLESGIEPTW